MLDSSVLVNGGDGLLRGTEALAGTFQKLRSQPVNALLVTALCSGSAMTAKSDIEPRVQGGNSHLQRDTF